MNEAALHLAVRERLGSVWERMARAGALPGSVKVVAVTKGFGPQEVEAALAAGLADIGENYAQELLAKVGAAPPSARWHYLGALQRNKVPRLAPYVHLWHSLDNQAAAVSLGRHRPGAAVLVQVRAAGRPPRRGASVADVPGLVDQATRAGLQVRGLMAVGPPGGGRAETQRCFREVARLGASLGLAELSMGMSDDFELAVAEGSTMVRLGRALFGERPHDEE